MYTTTYMYIHQIGIILRMRRLLWLRLYFTNLFNSSMLERYNITIRSKNMNKLQQDATRFIFYDHFLISMQILKS